MSDSLSDRPAGLRLLVVVTGSACAAGMPVTLAALRREHPEHELRVVVTRSATRFVTLTAVSSNAGAEALVDEWPEGSAEARHVAWAAWADAILVLPATLSFVARLATGMADSPALLAAQCSTGPVVLAPALPPGGVESAAYRMHRDILVRRPNVALAPPRPGLSATTDRPDAWSPAPLDEVLELVDDCRERHGTLPVPHDVAVTR